MPVYLLKEWALRIAYNMGFVRYSHNKQKLICARIESLKIHEWEWEEVARLFSDDESRSVMVLILAYRVLGYRHVALPLYLNAEWKKIERKSDSFLVHADIGTMEIDAVSWPINRYDLELVGYECQLEAPSVANTFILEQYRFHRDNCPEIAIRDGDIVIDGGGCMGDTALYAACRSGSSGRVLSFEFDVNNLIWLRRNLDLNPCLKPRIQVMPFALLDHSGDDVSVDGCGPSARIVSGAGDQSVQSMTIDDLIKKGIVDRIDFIKLDVEGAELKVLKGAEMALRQFRPRLAISVYHNENDMWELPLWLKGLGLDYRFYLNHFTIHTEETVLFAIV
jgi:FkbM family methyltransferase